MPGRTIWRAGEITNRPLVFPATTVSSPPAPNCGNSEDQGHRLGRLHHFESAVGVCGGRARTKSLSNGLRNADFIREGQSGAEGLGSADRSGGDRSPIGGGRRG
jgi:hypothetical protein